MVPGNPFTDDEEKAWPRHNQSVRIRKLSHTIHGGLVQLVLQGHVRLGLEADASAEDVGQGGALLGQGVDDGGAGRRERCLEHVAEDAEDAVEALVAVVALAFPLDARHHLRDEHEVDNEGRGEQGVFADVEDAAKESVTSVTHKRSS